MYHALIMAGGSGTRLWPLSRESQPKQALTLIGQRSLFQQAVDRLGPLFPPERIAVVTRAGHAGLLGRQVPELPARNFIVEPAGRGTAPAIGLAAIHLQHQDPQAVMAVLTADHFIQKTEVFRQALQAAYAAAGQDYLVTLGVKPAFAATGFGYIEQAELLGEANGLSFFQARRFIEKPAAAQAEAMLSSGSYSWNSGMFVWKVSRILEELERQMPGLYAQLMEIEAVLGTPEYETTIERVWPEVAKETIDYGILENAGRVAVIPVEMGWTDVGSWSSLLGLLPADENGNIRSETHLGIDTENCLIIGGQRLVATLGVQDLIIVDTPDALLVMSKEHDQQVKQLVALLKAQGQNNLL